jgi:hypothetical protein
METNANELLAVGRDGSINVDPLAGWALRFAPKTNHWTRYSLRKVGLPRPLSRATVAQEVGATEDALKAWEEALKAKVLPRMDDAAELLKVDANGLIILDPLAKWQLRFYPESGRWRRTRSNRDEVPRLAVARKVGVAEDILVAWEAAMLRRLQQDES